MEFKSGFLETLKLLLKDKYILSDGDLKSLSDIIFSFGMDVAAEEGLVTSLMFFMEDNNMSFPISYNCMSGLWSNRNLTVNFDSMLSNLVSYGLVTLRKLQEESFFNSANINKSDLDVGGQNYYIVVYGTSVYNEMAKAIKASNILNIRVSDIGKVVVTEGVALGDLDRKYKDFLNTIVSLTRKKLFTDIVVESFEYDSIRNEIEFNFVINITDAYKIAKADLNRILKKNIKNDMFISFESYLDGRNKIFLNVKIDMRILPADLKDIAQKIVNGFNELLDYSQGGSTDG